MKRRLLTTLLTLSVLVSCGALDDAKKGLKETRETTGCMAKASKDSFMVMKSGESENKRQAKFKALFPNLEGMGNKLYQAAVYFKGLEHQLYTNNKCYDNAAQRETMFYNSAKEFSRRMSDVHTKLDGKEINMLKIANVKDISKVSLITETQMGFVAYAVGMHMDHHFQEVVQNRFKGYEMISFYDLVKQALRKEKQLAEKKIVLTDLTDYDIELADSVNKEILLDLINARYNFLTVLALKQMVDKSEMKTGAKISAAWYKAFKGKLGGKIKVPSRVTKVNAISRDKMITYLDGALKAKAFLQEIGQDNRIKLDREVNEILTNLDQENKDEDKQVEEVYTLLNQVLL